MSPDTELLHIQLMEIYQYTCYRMLEGTRVTCILVFFLFTSVIKGRVEAVLASIRQSNSHLEYYTDIIYSFGQTFMHNTWCSRQHSSAHVPPSAERGGHAAIFDENATLRSSEIFYTLVTSASSLELYCWADDGSNEKNENRRLKMLLFSLNTRMMILPNERWGKKEKESLRRCWFSPPTVCCL